MDHPDFSIYTMDHPDLTISNFMENSMVLKGLKSDFTQMSQVLLSDVLAHLSVSNNYLSYIYSKYSKTSN